MALRAVPNHPKFAHLKRLLGQPKGCVLGWLEAIWHFTGIYAPQGNVGKYTNEEIEAWVEWDGEPGALIFALRESKWIDESTEHRLLVHDWAEHADKATKQMLGRKKLAFIGSLVPSYAPTVPSCGHEINGNGHHKFQPYAPPAPEPAPEPEPGAAPEPCAKCAPPSPERTVEPDTDADWQADPAENIPDGLAAEQYAKALMEFLRLTRASAYPVYVALLDVLPMLAKDESCGLGEAARRLWGRIQEAQRAGPVKWRYWLGEDGGWRAPVEISTEGWE